MCLAKLSNEDAINCMVSNNFKLPTEKVIIFLVDCVLTCICFGCTTEAAVLKIKCES